MQAASNGRYGFGEDVEDEPDLAAGVQLAMGDQPDGDRDAWHAGQDFFEF
ncbi:MAG: hypothetical protein HRU11_06430, partial [Parvularculaceae bacterium]|nr:hypothetical protein [Parvularculaceae bacterium]